VDARADEGAGGAFAWGMGDPPPRGLAVAVATAGAGEEARATRRTDRQADRDDDAALAEYNARLAQMAERDGAAR